MAQHNPDQARPPQTVQVYVDADEVPEFPAQPTRDLKVVDDLEETESSPTQYTAELNRPTRAHKSSTDSIRLYLKGIGEYDLLTAEEERELSRRIKAGRQAARTLRIIDSADETSYQAPAAASHDIRQLMMAVDDGDAAHHHMVSANLRLVVSVAKRYQEKGLPLLDLIQEGNLGLIHAAEKFKGEKGFRFSTYATWWIRQAVTHAISQHKRGVRLPHQMGEAIYRFERDWDGVSEPPEDIAKARAAINPLSLDEGFLAAPDIPIQDTVADPTVNVTEKVTLHVYDTAVTDTIRSVIANFDEDTRRVIELRFGFTGQRPLGIRAVSIQAGMGEKQVKTILASTIQALGDNPAVRALVDMSEKDDDEPDNDDGMSISVDET